MTATRQAGLMDGWLTGWEVRGRWVGGLINYLQLLVFDSKMMDDLPRLRDRSLLSQNTCTLNK